MDLSQRVARRFKAELLTKRWLMGVRRGWLSLMKPRIRDWDDVQRAIDKLHEFVKNLGEQTNYVRRGVPNPKRDKLFANLLKEVKDQRSRAEHWMRVHKQTGLPGFPPEDGAKMLKLYQTNFAGAMTTEVRTRGGYNPTRVGSLTELLDKILASLRADAKRLKEDDTTDSEVMFDEWREPAFKEFSYGRMKVVVIDAVGKGSQIRQYVRHIDKAYQLLKRKGFGKLWYGTMFLGTDSNKLSEEEQRAYKAEGYEGLEASAGMYSSGADVVDLTTADLNEVAEVIAHELGHRYWYKFMSSAQRAEFKALIDVKAHKYTKKEEIEALKDAHSERLWRLETKRQDAVEALQGFEGAKDILEMYDAWSNAVSPMLDVEDRVDDSPLHPRLSLKPFPIARSDYAKIEREHKTLKAQAEKVYDLFESFAVKHLEGKDNIQVTPELTKLLKNWRREVGDALWDLITASEKLNEKAQRAQIRQINYTAIPVSDYGRSNIKEAWAEVFAYYVMGHDLTRDQIESFREVLASTDGSDTELSLMQPHRRELCGYPSYSYSRA